MFSLQRPTSAQIEAYIRAAADLPPAGPRLLHAESRQRPRLPFLFARDLSTSVLGRGQQAFAAARRAFERWAMFDLGWVRVANPSALVALGQPVAVEAQTLGLWTLNVSRIVEVIDTPLQYGFVYATSALHVEEGEERFLLELDPNSGVVIYRLEAVSRPRAFLARLGFPITRSFQHRFVRDTHRRMHEQVCQAATLEA